jgi:ribonuclease VapC
MMIDSSALVALHLKEPGCEAILDKIASAEIAVISAPALLEAAIVLSARTRQDARAMLRASLQRLGIQVVPFTEEHYDAAIDAFLRFGKGRHPASLNFGDCMAYAASAVSGLPLLHTGSDFSRTDIEAA